MRDMASAYGFIMAGGSGERFWPLSRTLRPKQCLSILGSGTMLQQSYRRLRAMLPAKRIFILTRKGIEKMVAQQLPELPKKNIVAEPTGRDTAACIVLGACLLQREDPNAVMMIVPADQAVQNPQEFIKALKSAAPVAQAQDVLITVGVTPTEPATGYGYLQVGERFGNGAPAQLYRAQRYHEKPDRSTAEAFLQSGKYVWNSGMFIWKAKTILNEMQKYLPAHANMAQKLMRAKNAREFASIAERLYAKLPKISVDYGVLEKSAKVLVMRSSLRWDDLGSWTALTRYLDADADGNSILGNAVIVDGRGNLVRSDSEHLVGVVGTQDLVIVHTRDATLVCPKNKVSELKKLVGALRANPKTKRFA